MFGHGAALMAGASAFVLLALSPAAHARSLNGGSAGGAVSAPNIAADAASQAAQQAAAAAAQSQQSLARAARALQDIQTIQAAARAAAAAAQTSATAPIAVPNGLGAGGLMPNMPAGWTGANAPTQSVDGAGQTQVNVRQLTQQAILNWQSFNVGARTTLTFDQQGQANWVALNRVNNATAPSQILGNIKADGHVYVINQSGIIFGGNSQVNVGSLIASTAGITDDHFRAHGIFSAQSGSTFTPSFTATVGKVIVETGASINTHAPKEVRSGGGFVLMLGSEVQNAGSIGTPNGQALLAAGDSFNLRPGFTTDGNATSTTRGIEIAPIIAAGATRGIVGNSGLIFAQQGDVTLAGRNISQNGVLIATTSVNTRGTIHLLNATNDGDGSITLNAGSLTTILPEVGSAGSLTTILPGLDSKATALDGQRDALIAASNAANAARAAHAVFNNLSLLADRQDQSRIEIVTGGNITFKGGSDTAAQGGQIAATAGKRIFAEDGARLDVSGVRGVALAMESNNVKINVQGNELRDSPQNREADALKNNDVWIDVRSLTLVPNGTGGYSGDRYYTKGGLLEVGGQLANTAHRIGEWAAIGGTITLSAPEVIAQKGSIFDISGGSLDYASGWIHSTNLIASNGRRYSADSAPGDLKYSGYAGAFRRSHNIQGQEDERLTEIWTTVFDRGRNSKRWEEGYTVGRDAGRLNLSAPTSLIAATIVADTVTGTYQNSKRASGVTDGYKATQTTVAQNGTLGFAQYTGIGRAGVFNTDVRIGDVADITAGITADSVLPTGRSNTLWLDAGWLKDQQLGGLDLATRGSIAVNSDLKMADGGVVRFTAANIDIRADIVAHSGSVTTSNIFTSDSAALGTTVLLRNNSSTTTLHDGATIDVTGVFANGMLDTDALRKRAYVDGGEVNLNSSRDIKLAAGSVIDVSSGAAILFNGDIEGGRGGNVTLEADRAVSTASANGRLTLDGTIKAYGVAGGGTLTIAHGPEIVISDGASDGATGQRLGTSLFQTGFAHYDITGNHGLTVADGTVLDVVMPTYRVTADAFASADGTGALEPWLQPLVSENPRTGLLTWREGASLTLSAGLDASSPTNTSAPTLRIGTNAEISVDPGQSIDIGGAGQITIDGRLNAWGGEIAVRGIGLASDSQNAINTAGHGRSIWIGEHAVLDVAGRAYTATDVRGRRYGEVLAGGKITIGGELDTATGQAMAPNLFVVVRDGALLDASGAAATLDLWEGGETLVATNGGAILFASNNGFDLSGTWLARAGGQGAAGGTLAIALETPVYAGNATPRVMRARELVLTQTHTASALAADATPDGAANQLIYGRGAIGVDQIADGGFDSLNLLSHGAIGFGGDVSLSMRQNLQLFSHTLGLTETARSDSRVSLAAPYVSIAGITRRNITEGLVAPVSYLDTSSTRASVALFAVTADLLDIQREVRFGIASTFGNASSGGVFTFDRRGFDDVELTSTGDLRFLPGAGSLGTLLRTRGDLLLAGRQLYPTTGAMATIRVGVTSGSGASATFDRTRALTIRSTGAAPTQQPHSVFGSLTMEAATINQGGTIRAPLGLIQVGSANSSVTAQVNLLPGSITSTSSRGLVMPYGGTVDDIDWFYAGSEIALEGVASTNRGVVLSGGRVDIQGGAQVDLSGGGELLGAGFISGRGGSVDVLNNPLATANPAYKGSNRSNAVYAIVPGYTAGQAPVGGSSAAPLIGQQITLDRSLPGLPAGTYTLLPASYALMPGAFRIEIGAADPRGVTGGGTMANGSMIAGGALGFAHTQVRESLNRQVIVTPADAVRQLSQYNESTYTQFALADAARLGVPRAMIPLDGKTLTLQFTQNGVAEALRFAGTVDFSAAEDGFAGSAVVIGSSGGAAFEIMAAGAAPTAGFAGVSLYADALNALGAGRLVIGGRPQVNYGQQGNYFTFTGLSSSRSITLREGAVLRAPEVVLLTGGAPTTSHITIEAGAGINTLGMGATPFDSRDGFIYTAQTGNDLGGSMLAISNGWLDVLPADATVTAQGAILIGACGASGNCAAPTTLYSEGTIAFATTNRFELGENVRYGTRNLSFGVGAVNIGTDTALAAASASGVLPSGLMLNQAVLDRLLRGDTSTGAPALESLILNASEAVNIFGTVTLDTYDASGKSRIANLVLGTPAIYGAGSASDVATIRTENLVWSGSTRAPGSVITGGAGTGSGAFVVDAERITLGYGQSVQISGIDNVAQLALGFANVTFDASDRITANHKGSLAVYQSRGAYAPTGYSYSGGNLTLLTPMLTGEAGSSSSIKAGGAILAATPGGAAPAKLTDNHGLGAELKLEGQAITLATTVALPSGRFTASAEGDVILTDAAQLDLAGRQIGLYDASKYSWGGEVIFESLSGNVRQAAGSVIDISARHNHAGRLSVAALGASAGMVDLQGKIFGSTSGEYDAGGTIVPYLAGYIDLRAQRLGDGGTLTDQFAALNARLNASAMHGGRSFQLKQGDLVIGDGLKAGEISVSVDGGHLTVVGTVDASGAEVGVIRLAAKQGLTIAGSAVLDAHGKRLRVDSYGKIIDSPNRAVVELNSGDGTLTLGYGMRVDLRHGTDVPVGTGAWTNDGVARGTLDLYAPRLGGATAGDIAIDASGTITISGARSIAVNAVQRYSDAAYGTDPAASGRPYQVIDQAYLDAKHSESAAFIDNALLNTALLNGKLAGLNNATYREAFHLRPSVEIVSATADGDIVVQGDLDLSGYRYASLNPNFPRTGVIGSGEVGSLAIRAGGNLNIYGSINDGFAKPATTADDDGWMLREGLLSYGSDVVAPRRLTLADGTGYPGGRAVNYDLPLKQMMAAAGTLLPVEAVTATVMTVPANTILGGDIRAADGTLLFAAGTRVAEAQTLPVGTRLGAGFVLPAMTTLNALTWPKGVPLPTVMEYNQYNTLVEGKVRIAGSVDVPMGGLIPSRSEIELPGNTISLPLRPADGNGRQGANWAVASMLPAGSQSWSLRMVAGADITAADQRALRPRDANGNLTLADTHFTVFDKRDITVIPGTPEVPGFVWYWTEQGAADLGVTPGTAINEDEWGDPAAICADGPQWCVKVSYLWSDLAPDIDPTLTPGTPVSAEWEAACADVPSLCVRLRDPIPGTPPTTIVGDVIERNPANPNFSVLRTGTGDLDIVAGGNISMRSPYGVYTAGTQSQNVFTVFNQSRATSGSSVLGLGGSEYEAVVAGANSTYQAWYPTLGGNLLLRAGGDITGDAWTAGTPTGTDGNRAAQKASTDPANWLWRQGDVAGSANGAAWWINFGTYVAGASPSAELAIEGMPYLVGFTGYGTLGGGDLRLEAGGNAGTVDVLSPGGLSGGQFPRSQALTLAVASTGRVGADGSLTLTGGGDMNVRIGGALNSARNAYITVSFEERQQNLGLNGLVANLRGHTGIAAASQGSIELRYGPFAAYQDLKEVRAYGAFTSTTSYAGGGLMLMPGDSTFSLTARGDLVLSGVRDAGRTNSIDPNAIDDATGYQLTPWFTLWTDRTAIDMFAAGGNLTPSTQLGYTYGSGDGITPYPNAGATAGRFVYPSILRAVAPAGSIYLGPSAVYQNSAATRYSLLVAPSANGELELLAGESIYAGGYAVTRSGADTAVMPTPFNPATMSNLSPLAFQVENNIFAFGADTASGLYDLAPARYYAVTGDIVGLRTGEIMSNFNSANLLGRTFYEAGGAVWIKAGRDIVNSGTNLEQFTFLPNNAGASGRSTGNLIVHSSETDVSIVSAGRDILYSSFSVAGPGALEINAGRNILMENRAGIVSLGPVISGDPRPGASVYMAAGLSANGPDFAALASRYLDPANAAVTGTSLTDQPGKAVQTADAFTSKRDLTAWLKTRFSYQGDEAGALAYFQSDSLTDAQRATYPSNELLFVWLQSQGYRGDRGNALVYYLDENAKTGLSFTYSGMLYAWMKVNHGHGGDEAAAKAAFGTLPAEQQAILLRQIYFAELKMGGREYNDASGPRHNSYLRGREAIATLFPDRDANGNPNIRGGDIIMYGGAGVRTLGGGDINLMTPAGRVVVGVEGVAPPSTAGLITQEKGSINIYAHGSVLLGLSRIMTTFGGDITAWSAEGDINAGRGAKSTIIYTPPRRTVDAYGNVRLAPVVPSSGAGIATLNPVPDVAPGNIDLIAPLGTIDAGEAGIRVSGNINLAALQVLNAANIQVQGTSTGIPTVQAPSISAALSSSNANAATQQTATPTQSNNAQPSVIIVEVLGYGGGSSGEPAGEEDKRSERRAATEQQQDPASPVQVIGAGDLSAAQRQKLTATERRNFDAQ